MNVLAEQPKQRDYLLNELSSCVAHMEALYESGFHKIEPEQDFVFREGRNNSWIRSLHAEHPEGASARCAIIGGSKVEIMNLMIFPKQSSKAPIFASEIIHFGSKVHVAVIDHQTPDGAGLLWPQIGELLKPYHTLHASKLSSGGELPEWARHHFTPWCIYTRPTKASETTEVCSAFCTYLDLWLKQWLPQLDSLDENLSLMNDYLHHHVVNTPGRIFLSKAFGADWTERYLNEFMYAPLH